MHHVGCPFVRHSLSMTFAAVLQGVNANQMCCPILSLFTEDGAQRERPCPMLPPVIILSFKQRLTKLGQDLTFITGKEKAVNPEKTFELKGFGLFDVIFYMISNKFVHSFKHQIVLKNENNGPDCVSLLCLIATVPQSSLCRS